MEIKIIEQKENPLLNRTRIKFEIHQDGEPVPSRLKVVGELSSKLKKDKELIIIRRLNADFGSSKVNGEAVIYSSKKVLERIESKYSLKRLESKTKSEEKPKEEPNIIAEEKPEEQKKEEKPAE